MGIRFLCPACHKKVHVKDHQAGLRGFCPKCSAKIEIPWQSTVAPSKKKRERTPETDKLAREFDPRLADPSRLDPESTISRLLPRVGRLISVGETPPADLLAEFPDHQWYVVPPTGTEPFGPADAATMRQWIKEGRVAPTSLVWRQDWAQWQKAGLIWSQLILDEAARTSRKKQKSAAAAKPKFESLAVPTMPASTPPGGAAPGSAMSAVPGSAGTAASASPYVGSMQSAASRPFSGSPSPAAHTNGTPATSRAPVGSGGPEDELYYPRRSRTLYWTMVVLLVIGILVMTVLVVNVLHKQREHHRPTSAPAQPSSLILPANQPFC
jgi:hypothetical protein